MAFANALKPAPVAQGTGFQIDLLGGTIKTASNTSQPKILDRNKRDLDFTRALTAAEFDHARCAYRGWGHVVRPEQGRDLCHDAILKYIDESGIEAYRIDLETAREQARRTIAERMAP